MSWIGPDAEPHRIETNNTEILIDNGKGVFGGFEFLVTLCFAYLPLTSSPEKDCIYNTVQMPEDVPIKGPNLKQYTRKNDLVGLI